MMKPIAQSIGVRKAAIQSSSPRLKKNPAVERSCASVFPQLAPASRNDQIGHEPLQADAAAA
jgi:hypothetical protein